MAPLVEPAPYRRHRLPVPIRSGLALLGAALAAVGGADRAQAQAHEGNYNLD